MLLHIQHGRSTSFNKFVIHIPDTDVLILCLGYLQRINGDLYIKTGAKDTSCLIDLQKIKEKFQLVSEENGYDVYDLFDAMLGFHAFTGCECQCLCRKRKTYSS